MSTRDLSSRAWAELGLLAVIWGGSFLAIRTALDEIPFVTAVAFRVGIAALVLWGWVALRRLPVPREPRIWGALLLMGLLNNVLPFSLMAWGQLHIETGLTSILNAGTAVFGVLIAALLLADENLTTRRAVGVGTGFLGVATAIGLENLADFDIRSAAQLAVVAGTVSYALAGVWARVRLQGLSPQVSAAGMLTGSSLVMIPAALLIDGPVLPRQPDTIARHRLLRGRRHLAGLPALLPRPRHGRQRQPHALHPARGPRRHPARCLGPGRGPLAQRLRGLRAARGGARHPRRADVARAPGPRYAAPMIYDTPEAWMQAPAKRISLFGMSGLGKTHLSQILREAGDWFHYSIDYRIGTGYLNEHINDNLKRHAMRQPFLANLLRTDSIYIGPNMTFENLSPLSTFLGQPGDPARGGLPFDEYARRQALHHRAEVNALLDTPHFIERARDIYGYDEFVCDTGGSICEVVDPDDPADPVMTTLAAQTLPVWIEGTPDHVETLVARFAKAPKPMCYRPAFLDAKWAAHGGDDVDPDAFATATYRDAITARHPRYAAMARNWGVTVQALDVATARDAADVIALVAEGIGRATAPA